ncbi:MAG: hypothetical protein ACOC87_02520 [Candidatus Natronoplasma sp.]
MRNKILTVTLCLFLLGSGVLAISGGDGSRSRQEGVLSNSLDSINQEDRIRESSLGGFTQGIYDFLGWTGSNIQDFLGWAGSNIQDFLGWTGSNIQDFLGWSGSNTYEGSAALGKGGIVLLLVILLIVISYGIIMI